MIRFSCAVVGTAALPTAGDLPSLWRTDLDNRQLVHIDQRPLPLVVLFSMLYASYGVRK